MSKISIIVPVYNVERYISQCIESLLSQTIEDIEIILIDDGSPDSSGSICDEYANRDSRIKVIHQRNQGVSVARNTGISVARGSWITFVDGDDWVEKNMCELALNQAEKYKADITIWSYFKNYATEEKELELIPGGDSIFIDDKDMLELKAIYPYYDEKILKNTVSAGVVWCKLYKKDFILDKNLRFKEGLTRAQDTVFSLNAFEEASKIVYFNKSLYHYRITNTSICSGTKYIKDTLTPFNSLLDEFSKFIAYYNKSNEFKDAFYGRVIHVLLWHMKHRYFHEKYKLGFFEKRKQIKQLIMSEPYNQALKNVNYNILPKKEKLMAKMYNNNLILPFYFIYNLHLYYEKYKGVKYE